MSHKSKRLAGHQFHNHAKRKIAHPGYAECETPWWDETWLLHCEMEASYVEVPDRLPAIQPAALLAPVLQPLLLAEWSVTTTPLRKAAIQKEKEMPLIRIFSDGKVTYPLAVVCDPVAYADTLKLYRARCAAIKAHQETIQKCLAAFDAGQPHSEIQQAVDCAYLVERVTQRIWDYHSADSARIGRNGYSPTGAGKRVVAA